jgi:hypothetical protein
MKRAQNNKLRSSVFIKNMSAESKRMYSLLRKARWITSKRDLYTLPARNLGDYRFKLWLFSKLTRELSGAGLETAEDLLLAVKLGEGIGQDIGWERPRLPDSCHN